MPLAANHEPSGTFIKNMADKIPATAVVLTYNSAVTLEQNLDSLKDFAEILILDGGSNDETLEIAEKYGARIEQQSDVPGPISDFTEVRRKSFELAKFDWIMWIDSDEWLDQELIQSVAAAVALDNPMKAYRVSRVPVINGKNILYASFLPDMIIRLVNRKTVAWAAGKRVHEHVILRPEMKKIDLAGSLYTPWFSLSEYDKRDRYYISLAFGRAIKKPVSIIRTMHTVLKNLAIAFVMFFSWLYYMLRYGRSGHVLPWGYQLRFIRYHFKVIRERIRQYFYGTKYTPPAA